MNAEMRFFLVLSRIRLKVALMTRQARKLV